MVPRNNLPDVEVILYQPRTNVQQALPVLFNIHGGAWVGGDASGLDTQSQQLADSCACYVVNINYHKVDDEPFPFCQYEVRDTVLYFAVHADEFHIDASRFTLIGYSAGGHICAGAALLLRDAGFALNSHIMCYPFLDFHTFDQGVIPGMESDKRNDRTFALMSEVFFRGGIDRFSPLMSPAAAAPEDLRNLSPAELIICDRDALYNQAFCYEKKLKEAEVPVQLQVFPESTHGFMEGNYPEVIYEPDEKQRIIRDQCFAYLHNRTRELWEY